jgi:tellurite resistance protein TehA-like permease
MKMNGISIFFMVAFFLFMQPLKTEARSTVFISVSVGGAVIVGGAFIFWGISSGSRVGHREPANTPAPPAAYSLTDLQEQGSPAPHNRLFQSHPEETQALALELPLVTYRW